MNIKRRTGRMSIWLVLCFSILLYVISCKKDDPTKAVISVLDHNSLPVAGAAVTLWQDTAVNPVNGVQSNIRITKLSDAGGVAEFEFELEAFLNIEVVFNGDTGRSFIRLEEHETVAVTVNL